MPVQTSEQRALLSVRANIRENHKTREGGGVSRGDHTLRGGAARRGSALSLPRRSIVCLRTCDDVEIPSCMGENENSCAKKKEKKCEKVKFPVDIVS